MTRQAADMTTESSASTRRSSLVPGVRVVARAAALTALAGVVLVVVAAVVTGGEAAAAAAVGAGLVILVVVASARCRSHVVASAMPTASLLVALVTYVTQLAIVLLVFLAITRGDAFSSDQARGWLAAAMVLATLVWTAAHLVLTARERGARTSTSRPGVSHDRPRLIMSAAQWPSPVPLRSQPSTQQCSQLPGGRGAVLRAVGWLLDQWLGTRFLVAAGVLLGGALGTT